MIDASGGGDQEYTEDCQVCCKPWQVIVTVESDGTPEVEVRAATE